MASAVDSRLAYARLSAVATASRLPTANRGSNNSYTTSWDTTLYARYSSELQRDASIEDRLRLCRERAEREGWRIAESYSDRSISGTSLLRPGTQALMEDGQRQRFDIVLSEALDRISRDQEEITGVYKRLTFAGVRMVTLSEGDITELHIGLKGTMGALYIKDLADKTRRGLRGRVENGKSGGGNSYGYRVVHETGDDGELIRGSRTIDPEQAAVVNRIFTEYAAGRSPREITHRLNAEGIAGPRGTGWGPENHSRQRQAAQRYSQQRALYRPHRLPAAPHQGSGHGEAGLAPEPRGRVDHPGRAGTAHRRRSPVEEGEGPPTRHPQALRQGVRQPSDRGAPATLPVLGSHQVRRVRRRLLGHLPRHPGLLDGEEQGHLLEHDPDYPSRTRSAERFCTPRWRRNTASGSPDCSRTWPTNGPALRRATTFGRLSAGSWSRPAPARTGAWRFASKAISAA